MDEIGHEEHEEGHGCTNQSHTATRADILIGHVVHHIEDAQHTGQEYHGEAQYQHPGVEQGVEAVGGIGPARDDGCDGTRVNQIVLGYEEVGTLEEGGHRSA